MGLLLPTGVVSLDPSYNKGCCNIVLHREDYIRNAWYHCAYANKMTNKLHLKHFHSLDYVGTITLLQVPPYALTGTINTASAINIVGITALRDLFNNSLLMHQQLHLHTSSLYLC